MIKEEVDRIYRELEAMVVPLDQTSERGPVYLKERLLVCRRMQDRVSGMLLKINQEFSRLKILCRALRASVALAGAGVQAPALREELRTAEDDYDEVRYLAEAVEVKRANLRQTGSDIRLLAGIMAEGMRLGEVQPPKKLTPVRETTPFEIGPGEQIAPIPGFDPILSALSGADETCPPLEAQVEDDVAIEAFLQSPRVEKKP